MSRTRTNLEKTTRLQHRLADIYMQARTLHYAAETLSVAKRNHVYDHLDGLTRYEIGYLRGYDACLFDTLYRVDLVWRLGFANAVGPEGVKWDYDKDGVPTHGGYFWRGTSVSFDGYKPL